MKMNKKSGVQQYCDAEGSVGEETGGKKMDKPSDNGYISEYLIHWTGKDGEKQGADILSIIAESLKLLLSYNPLHSYDFATHVYEKMVCFTDVPLNHSHKHCSKYGKFGIAFKKQELMCVGAQPVFYSTHVSKHDMDKIFRFLMKQTEKTTIDKKLYDAFKRHFYFMKRFSDSKDTHYYEREWRLGEQTLVTEDERQKPNFEHYRVEKGHPPYFGNRIEEGGKSYSSFKVSDVAFLIAPEKSMNKIRNPHNFPLYSYESLK